MSSRNPDELRDELKSIDFTGDPELLAELRSEARETVSAQQETLTDIDSKASRILRLNVLLIGILVSALSITAQNGGDSTMLPRATSFANWYMRAGVGSLVLSTTLAAITYTASELDIGVSSTNVVSLMKTDFDADEARELLVKNYAYRINFNRSTSVRNTPLITGTIVFLVSGVVFLALGTYRALVRPVPLWLLTVASALLLAVVVLSDLIPQLRLAVRDVLEWR